MMDHVNSVMSAWEKARFFSRKVRQSSRPA